MKTSRSGTTIESRQEGLRCGYTTGTCSAAAAKAAAAMLFSGEDVREISVTVPAGETFLLEIVDICRGDHSVRCGVVKDAGDDPDCTNGMKVFACVSRSMEEGIQIDGGEGIGRVTKPGLDQPVGSAAINSTPRRMIAEAIEEEKKRFGETGGIAVMISIPGGREVAENTFNPSLGIEGGLSILGTSGIVEPMSERALVDTIALSVRQKIALGNQLLIMAPGNYGLDFLRKEYLVSEEDVIKISNYVGDSLDMAVREGARGVLLTGHIGKLVKVAGGHMNTHSRVADGRMEILASHAAGCGAREETLSEIADCVTTEAALDVLASEFLLEPVMKSVLQAIGRQIDQRTGKAIQAEVIVFSTKRGILARTDGAEKVLREYYN